MDSFLGLSLAPTTLSRLNFCQLWLKVTLISNISNLQGRKIEQTAWNGFKHVPLRRVEHQVMAQYQMAPLMKATDHTLVEEPIKQKMQKSLRSIALCLQHIPPNFRLSTDAPTQAISQTQA
jgi:hypothetical protein